jgi:hypothetical protein
MDGPRHLEADSVEPPLFIIDSWKLRSQRHSRSRDGHEKSDHKALGRCGYRSSSMIWGFHLVG